MILPSVTVIIPVRNGERFLEAMFSRVVSVLDSGVDVIVVDDHSTDSTKSTLETFARTRREIAVMTNTSAPGVASARNFALNKARGEYVWFADADDAWEPEILQRLRKTAVSTGAEICVSRADLRISESQPGRIIDGLDHSSVVDRKEAWQLIMQGRLHGYLWNKLFRRSSLGVEPFLQLSSQSDFTGVVTAVAGATRIAFMDDVLYHHIVRPGSVTRSASHRTQNLAVCVDHFSELAEKDVTHLTSRPAFLYFRVWFEILPLAETPARVGASWKDVADGGRVAREKLAALKIAELSGSKSLVLRAHLVRLAGPVYSVIRGFALRTRLRWRQGLS